MRVVRWLILVFPCIMLFSAIGLFQSEISDLIVLTLIAVVVTMGPTVAYKLNAPVHIMKKDYSSKAVQMADEKQSLSHNSLEQAEQIAAESENQTAVTGEVENTFRRVNVVSQDLISISTVEPE